MEKIAGWKLLFALMLGYLLGILIWEMCLEGEWGRLVAFALLALGVWVWGVRALIWLVFLIGMVLGMWRFDQALALPEDHIANFLGEVEFEGCVETEVDQRVDKVKYTVDAYSMDGREVEGKVLINASRYPLYRYGDCFVLKGELERPEKIEDFDYDHYLARYEVFAVLYKAEMTLIERRSGDWLFERIYRFKAWFEGRLNEVFSEPHASFVAGLLLGSRKGIPDHLLQDFNTTGLTHIIAISGYNITLLIVIVAAFFGFLTRRVRVIVSVLVIFVFVVLVGMSAAVVRAGIMGVIGLIALWFGRVNYIGITMLLAAFVMCLWNPLILIYDVGFQLSFLATLGLVYVSPGLERWVAFLPEMMAVRESASATLSAQALALPVILLNFGRLSLISPIANVFVLPLIPLAMFFGFLAVSFSFLNEGLGMVFGFITYLFLDLMILMVKFFAAMPAASVDFKLMGWGTAFVYYLLIGWWIWKKNLTK